MDHSLKKNMGPSLLSSQKRDRLELTSLNEGFVFPRDCVSTGPVASAVGVESGT